MALGSGRVPQPTLTIEILDNTTSNFGPTDAEGRNGPNARPKRIIHDAVSVGASWYSRFPSNAFWTLRKNSIHNAAIVPGLDHVRIWYHDDQIGYGPVLIFNGRVGDPDESSEDVVWTAWSYSAELALSRTGYNVMYPHKLLGTEIVRAEWDRDEASGKFANYGAKTREDSLLGHIATGTFQDPRNSTNSVDVRSDRQFGVMDVPRLLFFFDMTEMGRANTNNNVVFEISRSTTPTFNFWKNKGTAQTARALTFPGTVRDFRYVRGVLDIRNDLATIGVKQSKATEIVKTVETGTYGANNFGRRQDTFAIKTLAGYPVALIDDEATGKFQVQSQITQAAVREASQLTRALRLDVRHDYLPPFLGWDIDDTVRVAIKSGITQINQMFRVVGWRAKMDDQGFAQQFYVTLPTT